MGKEEVGWECPRFNTWHLQITLEPAGFYQCVCTYKKCWKSGRGTGNKQRGIDAEASILSNLRIKFRNSPQKLDACKKSWERTTIWKCYPSSPNLPSESLHIFRDLNRKNVCSHFHLTSSQHSMFLEPTQSSSGFFFCFLTFSLVYLKVIYLYTKRLS